MVRPLTRNRPPANVLPNYVLVVPLLLGTLVLVALSFTLVVAPRKGASALLYTQLSTSSTASTSSTTTSGGGTNTTTSSGGVTTTTSGGGATIPPGGFTALTMTCPPNITITFGDMLLPMYTGTPNVTAGNYVGCTSPVTTYEDMANGLISSSKKKKKKKENDLRGQFHQQLEWEDHAGDDIIAMKVHHGRSPGEFYSSPSPASGGKKRTPFHPQNNLQTVGPFYNTPYTGEAYPDATSAVSSDRVVSVVKTPTGSFYTVTSIDHGTVLGQFSAASSLAMPGGACVTSQGDGHVLFDYHAQRWLLVERAAAPYMGNYYLCLYVSFDANPLGMYTAFEISFPVVEPQFPRMGVWNNVYALTINATVQNTCVIDRAELLSGTFVGFCSTPLSGTLSGFMTQSWAPLSLDGDSPMPPPATENGLGQGFGAVFMRHRDDELHNGATTPAFDMIDVEHWSNINFTDNSYFTLRYPVSIQDFDSSFASCTNGPDACIPTPGVDLDPVRQYLTHQLLYRNRGTLQEKVVGSFVSHANGVDTARVRWFELSFQMPTPTVAPQFVLFEEGVLPFDDGLHRWLPAISQDANGTDILVYNYANATTMPGLAATYRAITDGPSEMREEHISFVANPSQSAPTNSGWGQYASVHSWPDGPQRWFFVSHSYLDAGNWNNVLYRLHVQGEIINRTWTAEDGCNITTCEQYIFID